MINWPKSMKAWRAIDGVLRRVHESLRERQRQLDVELLWPSFKANAPDLDHAKAAFAFHAFHDVAWLSLGEEEIKRRIDALE